MNVVIGFINSVANSHVILEGQGISYDKCFEQENTTSSSIQSIKLAVIFYETKKFQSFENASALTSLLIKDISFISHYAPEQGNQDQAAFLRIMKLTGKLSYEVALENVSWCHNDLTSTGFSTMALLANSTRDPSPGELHLMLTNIFVHNNVIPGQVRHKRSDCLVCFSFVNVTMTGTNYFANNSGGSVIGVVASNLTVSGDLTIKDGYAYKGGAINLDSTSTLYLKEPLVARFYNNYAFSGSAIYAPVRLYDEKQSVIQILPTKQYSLNNLASLNISMHFGNNSEDQLTRSFYAPHFSFFGEQISPYFDFKSSTWDPFLPQYAYTTLIDTILHMDRIDKFTSLTNGLCVQLQPGQEWECVYIDGSVDITTFDRPSMPFSTRVYPNQVVLSLLHVSSQILDVWYRYSNGTTINYEDWTFAVDGNRSSVSYNYSPSFNDSNGYYVVQVSYVESKHNSKVLWFERLECPLGFCLTNESCMCDTILKNHNYSCHNADTITTPSGYWTGIHTEVRFAENCPPNFCKDSVTFPPTDQNLTQTCAGNRTGILCGECQDGFSVVFGSDACSSDCTDVYLLTLPVYALAGLLLVLVLFVLRLTVATGTINGVIFYANILGLVMDKLTATGHTNTHYKMFLRVFISLLNIDLGFPLCLYEGMTTVGKVGLEFVFPVYLWSIVIALILLARVSTRVANLISESSVQVLATLFYLTFSKLLRTAIVIFSPSTIHVIEGCGNYTSKLVWYFDGHDYGHSTHAVLLTLAVIFTLLFLLPYALLVTFSSCLVRFRVVNRFKPFIDAYGGPFKVKWRFWFGLRLWITILLFGLDGALQGKDVDTMLIVHIVVLVVFIVLQGSTHPFKNSLVGLLDTCFMANYWLLVTSHFFAVGIFSVMYYFLTSVAALSIISILVFHVISCLKKLNKRPDNARADYDEDDPDEVLLEAAYERENPVDAY